MQQNIYRNCFHYRDGWKIVSCDFAGQEVVVAATVCQEPTMLKILESGGDFLSYATSLMFPKEWAALGGDPEPKGKPSDPKLLKMRSDIKATVYGLFYGKSALGLADSLGIAMDHREMVRFNQKLVDEYVAVNLDAYKTFLVIECNGKDNEKSLVEFIRRERDKGLILTDYITSSELIDKFFNLFPNVKTVLVNGAKIAAEQCYIATTDVISRIRFFERPSSTRESKAIERAAMNLPIQGLSANMSKYAIAKLYQYIESNNLQDKVKFLIPVHDEIIIAVKEDLLNLDFVENQAKELKQIMEEAAAYLLKHNLQKAEYNISEVWMK